MEETSKGVYAVTTVGIVGSVFGQALDILR